MEFEWDEGKRDANLEKHDVDLVRAARIFEGLVVTERDERNDYSETRFRSIGWFAEICYVVVWTEREGRIRLISARIGGRRDRRRYPPRNS